MATTQLRIEADTGDLMRDIAELAALYDGGSGLPDHLKQRVAGMNPRAMFSIGPMRSGDGCAVMPVISSPDLLALIASLRAFRD